MSRLTKHEKEMLVTAAEFMLAGEWPVEDVSDEQMEKDAEALRSASNKLKEPRP